MDKDKTKMKEILGKIGDLTVDEFGVALKGAAIIACLEKEEQETLEEFIQMAKKTAYEKGKKGEPFK